MIITIKAVGPNEKYYEVTLRVGDISYVEKEIGEYDSGVKCFVRLRNGAHFAVADTTYDSIISM